MSRLESVFKQKNHKALIAYVTVGYPSIEATLKVVSLLADCGCDIVELGIPFSTRWLTARRFSAPASKPWKTE